jgi:RNA polymerase sigma-70 factor (ECF subfamily)
MAVRAQIREMLDAEPASWNGCASALELAAADSFQFIWRTLRRLGVRPESAVDDATQRVFEIAARKHRKIQPGHERAFLFKTAVLVAAEERRAQRRGREIADEALVRAAVDTAPLADQLLEQRRHRARLDLLLDELEPNLRTVFVLYELEGLTTPEISELLEIPLGTAASRLRRARSEFQAGTRRLRARLGIGGERP